MKSKGFKLACLGSCLVSSIATAGDMGVQIPAPRSEFGFSAGYYYAEAGQRQHINIRGLVGNTYTVNKKNNGNYLLGLSYLYNSWNYSRFDLAVGVKAFYLAPTRVNGFVNQEDIFTNLSYRYSLSHIPIYAMGRAMINSGSQNLAFTLDAGIGPNIMRTSGYKERSIDGGITIPDRAFHGHTDTKFSATAGAGIKFNNLMNTASFEIGYRFFYLGQGSLQPRTNVILNSLTTRNIYANALVLTVSI